MSQNETVLLAPFSATAASGVTKEQCYEAFIGKKYPRYYQEKFQALEAAKPKNGFNIAAFFLGAIWLFYRKMYGYGFIYLGLVLISGIISSMLNLSESIDRGLSMGVAVAMGLGGNGLYKWFIDKKISSPNISLAELKQQGGTNPIAAAVVLLLGIGFISLGVYLDG